MHTREAFERRRAAVRQVERHDGRWLAFLSVGLGVVQLLFLRWADLHLERGPRLAIAGGAFLAYAALIGVLVWRMDRRTRSARPTCPQCGVMLKGMSERVAAATGKCDSCGGQVIDERAARPSAQPSE
jgi:predicted RNA-binding Zn-ribbon protein involved in translation (DUF1610 family)